MRVLVAAAVFLGLAAGLAGQDKDKKLDEKFLVGTWSIKFVGGKTPDKLEKTIEFKDDGTYMWDNAGAKTEGTYKLNGTTLELTPKGTKTMVLWKDLSIKDGKIIHPISKTLQNELTRVEKK